MPPGAGGIPTDNKQMLNVQQHHHPTRLYANSGPESALPGQLSGLHIAPAQRWGGTPLLMLWVPPLFLQTGFEGRTLRLWCSRSSRAVGFSSCSVSQGQIGGGGGNPQQNKGVWRCQVLNKMAMCMDVQLQH